VTDTLRVPPHNTQAEQSLLGGLMLDNQTWDDIADQIAEADFYRRDHRLIFATIARLADAGQPLDLVTLSENLESRGQIEAAGGLPYLSALARETPSAVNVKAYARIVREHSVQRQLISALTAISDMAFGAEGRETAELLDESERRILSIADQTARHGQGFQPARSVMADVVARIEDLRERGSEIPGLETGFADLDRITGGLHPGELVFLAGRPSMGKTAFALNVTEHVAVRGRQPVALFSLEMPAEAIGQRLVASVRRINLQRLRTAALQDAQWPRLSTAVGEVTSAPLHIDDTSALSPLELRSRARRLKRELGALGLVVIDYLQLMTVPGTRENRTNEVAAISRALKGLAKELGCPVLALSQLNRNLEQRPNKRPVMADLRESGSIEQDADIVAFVYRDEIYQADSKHKGTAELIIGKHRNGPLATVRLAYLGQYTRFEDLARDPFEAESKPPPNGKLKAKGTTRPDLN